jgi:hypothetical protein
MAAGHTLQPSSLTPNQKYVSNRSVRCIRTVCAARRRGSVLQEALVKVVAKLLLISTLVGPSMLLAQDVSNPPQGDTAKSGTYANSMAGEFTPAKGFDLINTKFASLNISFYGLFRYLNQLPSSQTYTDHLGRERPVKLKNDLNWHRTMVWLTGFFFKPQFRYNITLWSLPTTQQTLLFGNLQYRFSSAFTVGAGLLPNLTARSMQGSWPFWAGSDRTMAEDLFRGGFSSGFFVSGQPVSRFYYTASVNTNLSQLGVVAANDSRDLALSASVFTMPSTGEFGPRGGLGDLEYHEQVATRFGISAAHSRESRYAPDSVAPNATQIRLSDGVFPFETGALADAVTVQKLDYDLLAGDAGFKYRGFSFQGEYYVRRLSNFQADGLLPLSSILDHGFMTQTMYMVSRTHFGLYASGGYVFDDFKRNPWELGGGASYYPSGTRSWRLNLHIMQIEKSPAGSNFGYYAAGQSGTIISLGTDILF